MRTISLEFEEYPDEVYEVTVSPVPLSAFEKVWELHLAALTAWTSIGDTDPLRAEVAEFVKVAKPTVKGKAAKLLAADPQLIFALVRMWHAGVRNVPLPLPRASSGTEPSPAE